MADEKRVVQDLKLMPSRMQQAEYGRTDFVVTVEQGVSVTDLQKEGFWSLVCARFRPYDRIEVRTDDGSYWAELLVLGCDRAWAKVHVLREASLTTTDVAMSQAESTYRVNWKGPHRKFCVIRKADGIIVHEGEQLKESAQTWARDHEKAMA